MADYRFYCLDNNGDIVKRVDVECDNDTEAFEKAQEHCAEYEIEVWLEDRRLYTIPKGASLRQARSA
jgi:hypothetical protein